ncbi:MAG: tripartite tricarboxylate transporter substrate binding protein [Alphaproteobacteria bacterium]|nr:tripartite tricarboxylate transporter substrate binding protein [Alphaproteobacteria bacterium]
MPNHRRRFSRRAILAGGAALALTATGGVRPARAQGDAYPNRAIRVVVPIGAGGGTDILARGVAAQMQRILGQPVVVENRAGASGTVGSDYVKRQAPDGYTLLVGTIGTHAVNQFLFRSLPYDPIADFVPISNFARYHNVILVPPESPFRTLQDLIAAAKGRPGALNYGITVNGSSGHLGFELFKSVAGLDIPGVVYQGNGPATADLIGGRLDVMMDVVVAQNANIEGGRLRPLAVGSLQRVPALPDVPAIAELGYPGFDAVGWAGLFAPTGTPRPIIERLHAAVREGLGTPELARIAGRGVGLDPQTPEQYAAFVRAEIDKWREVVRRAGIQAH